MLVFEGLTKVFKTVAALSDLSLNVNDKEIFGLLGPNGAGKTTCLMILCSVLRPTRGTIRLDGVDMMRQPDKARGKFGIAFQEPVLDSRLTVEQNLEFHADACGLPKNQKRERIREVLDYLDMWECRRQKAGQLSGGMKKKIEDAKLFVQKPDLAVFDEPTAYLDVPSRHRVWKRIQGLKEQGSTIVLATNMMDEADRLCDRVGILSKGRLAVVGTPSQLKDTIPKGDVIDIQVAGDTGYLMDFMGKLPDIRRVVSLGSSNRVRVYVSQAELRLPRIMEQLIAQGTRIESVDVKEPNLDDVFLHYTGETL